MAVILLITKSSKQIKRNDTRLVDIYYKITQISHYQ